MVATWLPWLMGVAKAVLAAMRPRAAVKKVWGCILVVVTVVVVVVVCCFFAQIQAKRKDRKSESLAGIQKLPERKEVTTSRLEGKGREKEDAYPENVRMVVKKKKPQYLGASSCSYIDISLSPNVFMVHLQNRFVCFPLKHFFLFFSLH